MSTEQSSSTGATLYSHDETVAAITSYYELVARAHAITERSELLHPPPEGWPQLNDPDVIAGYGFSDEALELVRHIPYFESSDSVQILPDVEPHIYIEKNLLSGIAGRGKSIRCGEAEFGEDRTPPHLVLLGFIPPMRKYGSEVWLDTKLGNVIMGNHHCNIQIEIGVEPDAIYPEPDDHSYDDLFMDLDSEGEGYCWRISTFFAACERLLRELEWIPGMDEGAEGYIIPREDTIHSCLDHERRQQIMRDNGWPGDNWNPAGVAAEVEQLIGPDGPKEEDPKEEERSSRCRLM